MKDEYYIKFNNFLIGGDNYFISKIDVGMPKSKLDKYNPVRYDGQIITNQNYTDRQIQVTGNIKSNELNDMIIKLDTLKLNTVGINKNLDVYYGQSTRRYTASLESFNYTTSGYFCEFEIIFSVDALAKDLSANALVFGTYTSSPQSYVNNIGGSYKSKPYIQLNFQNVAPFWTNKYLQIYNPVSNQTLKITRNWGIYDTVIIDGDNKTINAYATTSGLIDTMDSATGWTSGNTISLDSTTYVEGTGSLKVVMASAAASTDFTRLNATAVDLSASQGTVIIPIYLPTPTSGTVASVTLKIGSDATLTTNHISKTVTTDWNGNSFANSSWNYIAFPLDTGWTSQSGTPVRTAIKSISIIVNATTTMQLNGVRVDYISKNKPSVTSSVVDYEGTFPDLLVGSNTYVISDEFTTRKIVIGGSYYRKYL